jgi:hypothetical protein
MDSAWRSCLLRALGREKVARRSSVLSRLIERKLLHARDSCPAVHAPDVPDCSLCSYARVPFVISIGSVDVAEVSRSATAFCSPRGSAITDDTEDASFRCCWIILSPSARYRNEILRSRRLLPRLTGSLSAVGERPASFARRSDDVTRAAMQREQCHRDDET